MTFYKNMISPFLDRFDSETWHVRARKALHIASRVPFGLKALELMAGSFQDPRLRVDLNGVQLRNPIMVGAGWDKTGGAVRGLHALGFSAVEVGTVPAYSQEGNPKPRQWMISHGVCINCLGFNSPGMKAVAENLEHSCDGWRGLALRIGVSVGKNKDVRDNVAPIVYKDVVRSLYPYASYFTINVSSPNTPGLRKLQDKGPLTDIVQAVIGVVNERSPEGLPVKPPVYVKIAPDLTHSAVDDVMRVVSDNGASGIIACNTTIDPDIKAGYGEKWRNVQGGLSGHDGRYRAMCTEMVRHIYRSTGRKMTIIGVGGVMDAATALEKIMAGATAVQVVTAIRGEGPCVAARINRGLLEYMDRKGIKNISDLVGAEEGPPMAA